MSGTKNVRAQAVPASNEGVTRIARALEDLGIEVVDEVLIRAEHRRPSAWFERPDEG
jgi:hypothetical protein